jgi:hypothetical protein
MKRLLWILISILLSAPVFAQQRTWTFASWDWAGEITLGNPLNLTVTTDAPGQLNIGGRYQGKGASLDVSGPASCSSNRTNRYDEIFCVIDNAPAGTYTVVISPYHTDRIGGMNGTATGEGVTVVHDP